MVFPILFQFLMEKLDLMEKTNAIIVWFSWNPRVVTHDVHELANNVNGAQRIIHKDTKKKDCKAAFYIQSTVDTSIFH